MSKFYILKEWALEVMSLDLRVVTEGKATFYSFYRVNDNLFVGCVAKKSEIEPWLKGYKAALDMILEDERRIKKTYHSDLLGRVSVPTD